MARKIVITSGKGGVGKTTLCASLGAKLSLGGQRVLLVDVDIGLNNLDVVMGVENKVVLHYLSCHLFIHIIIQSLPPKMLKWF